MRPGDCGRARRALGLVAILLTMAAQAAAGTTWDGGGANDNWSTGANWNPDGVPPNTGLATIHFAGSTRLTPNADIPWSIKGLDFDNGAGAFTLSGVPLTVGSGGISNHDADVQAINNNITLAAAQSLNAITGSLTLTGVINNGGFTPTVSGGNAVTLLGAVIGSGGLSKTEAGTLTLAGAVANQYSGLTSVSGGSLVLAKSAGTAAIAGTLTVGDGAGLATVRLGASDQIADTAAVLVSSQGRLDLNGCNETINTLEMIAGSVTTGAGTLTVNTDAWTYASSTTSTISGNLSLPSGTHTFDVSDGAAGADLDISAVIGGGGDLTKDGAGTMRFSGASANTYAGDTTVHRGTLVLAKSAGTAAILGDLKVGDETHAATVRLEASDQLADEAYVDVFEGSLLDLNGFDETSIGLLAMRGGSVTTGAGTLTAAGNLATVPSATTSTISGNLYLPSGSHALCISDGAADIDLDISAAITGPGLLYAEDGGTVRLSGESANTYSGSTKVSYGTLVLAKSAGTAAIPGTLDIGDGNRPSAVRLDASDQIADTAWVLVRTSALLDLNGFNETVGTLFMTGGSVTTGAGTLTVTGSVQKEAIPTTSTISGNLRVDAFDIFDGAADVDLDVSAVISGGGFTKEWEGTLKLSGPAANTYTGPTYIDWGTLVLAKSEGAAAIPGTLYIGDGTHAATVRLGASDQIADTAYGVIVKTGALLDLNGLNETIQRLAMTAGSVTTGGGTLTVNDKVETGSSPTMSTIRGNLSLPSGTHAFYISDGAADVDLDIPAAIRGDGSLTKEYTGTLRLSGASANTYIGDTYVHEGTLALAKSAGTAAIPGYLHIGDGTCAATVRLDASDQITDVAVVTVLDGSLLDLNGRDEAFRGLEMTAASVTTGAGTLTLGATLDAAPSATTSTISGNLNLPLWTQIYVSVSDGAADVDLDIPAAIRGDGGLTKDSAGTMRLSGSAANTYTGDTYADEGMLVLAKSAGTAAIPGILYIGDGTYAATVRLDASDQIADTALVRLYPSALLDLNGFNETLDALYVTGGSVTTGAGTLTVNGKVQTGSSPTTSTISGNLSLPSGTHTFSISDGEADIDLDIPAVISGGGGLLKTRSGTLALSGSSSNSYTGTTTVGAGTLLVAAEGALGASAVQLGDTTGLSDAALLVAGQYTVDRPVTVQDDGSGSTVRTLGGTNSAGTALFSGDITLKANLTLAAEPGGEVRLTGALLNSGGKTVTKVGGGTAVLAGAQTHGPGARLVAEAGTVRLDTDAGSAGANLSISATGAALDFGSGQHLAALNLAAGTAQLAPGGGKVLVTRTLAVGPGSAVLDVTNNALTVDYPDTGPSLLADVAGWIRSGYRDGPGGYWDGPGITSSVAAADAGLLTAVGVLDNSDPDVGGKTTFAGEAVDATSVLVKYTYWGDANLDGKVDANDYDIIDRNFLFTPTPENTGWWTGDFTYDGAIDANDYDRMDRAFLFQGAPLTGGGAVPTPEPATLALLAVGALALVRRRRA